MKDEGYPTCSSKNFGVLEMKKDDSGSLKWKMQCYNCKKFWYSSKK
jgi:hypothetical protein